MKQVGLFSGFTIPAAAASARGFSYFPGKLPDAALTVAWAILRLGNLPDGHDEPSIIREAARMRKEGLHPFKLGSVKLANGKASNIRNRLQRNCANASIYQETWARAPHHYAAVFVRIGGEKPPAKWKVVDGFDLEDFTDRLARIMASAK
jgi:hypothetical protein